MNAPVWVYSENSYNLLDRFHQDEPLAPRARFTFEKEERASVPKTLADRPRVQKSVELSDRHLRQSTYLRLTLRACLAECEALRLAKRKRQALGNTINGGIERNEEDRS